MAFPSVTYTFTNGTTADATQVNQNFTDLINGLSDGTKALNVAAITAAGTYTANGNVVLGASSSNTLTVNASLASTIAISANNTYAIGSAGLGLSGLYLGSAGGFTTKLTGAATSSYTLTFPPAAPATAGYLKMDTSGTVTAPVLGQQVSSSCGDARQTGSAYADVTNLTVTITTTGRPVKIMTVSDGSGTASRAAVPQGLGKGIGVKLIRVLSGSPTEIGTYSLVGFGSAATTSQELFCLNHLDAPSANTYTYKLQQSSTDNATLGGLQYMKLVAYEL